MTSQKPAPLTGDEIRAAIKRAHNMSGPSDATQPAEYVLAGALALLSKLRAEGVQAGEVMDALNWVDDFIARCNRDDRGSCDSVNVLRRALASAPVAPAEVMDALSWVDDFIARCNRDDRGSCDSVNVLRRALASAPNAIPTQDGIRWQAGAWDLTLTEVMVDGRRWYRDDDPKVQASAPATGPQPVVHQHGFAADNQRLRAINESLDKQLEEVMTERDSREDIIDKLLDVVLGADRAEWSSEYDYSHALIEVEERMHALASAPVADQQFKAAFPNGALSAAKYHELWERASKRGNPTYTLLENMSWHIAQFGELVAKEVSAPVAGEAQARPQRVLTDDERAAVEFYSLNPSAAVRDLDKRLAGHAAPQASEAVRLLRKIREDDFLSDTQRHRIDRLLASAPVAGEAQTAASAEHYDELKATLQGLHRMMEGISAIERRVGPIGSHARGYTHKITSALRHLDALYAAPQASEAQCSCPSGDGSLRWPCAVHTDCAKGAGDERQAWQADMIAAGAQHLGGDCWEWDVPDFEFRLWQLAARRRLRAPCPLPPSPARTEVAMRDVSRIHGPYDSSTEQRSSE